MKNLLLLVVIFFQFNLHAEVREVTNPEELAVLTTKLNNETEALEKLKLPSVIENHLNELEKKINKGEVQLRFQTGNKNIRGEQWEDPGCGCSVISLSAEYIDSGVVSTLVHEFEHVKQHLLLEKLMKTNPELDKLTDIFGEYYYNKNEEVKKDPLFKRALFIGSALLFYMEYDAYKMQLLAIKSGVKDTIRKEKSNNDMMEHVANEYLIDHSINVDEKYIKKLATLVDNYSITDYIEGLIKSPSYEQYFQELQNIAN